MTKMRFYGVVVLLCVTIVMDKGLCETVPRELYNSIMKKTIVPESLKRHKDHEENCIINKLDETIGDDSTCKLAVVATHGYPPDEEEEDILSAHEYINYIYDVFCEHDCRRAAIDLYDDCEINTHFVDFHVGLCASDSSGKECYQSYIDGFDLLDRIESCYYRYKRNGKCSCIDELEENMEDIGCCLNVYHDFVHDSSSYYDYDYDYYMQRQNFTDACGVTLPGECNPLDDSATSVVQYFPAPTIMAAVVLIFILQ